MLSVQRYRKGSAFLEGGHIQSVHVFTEFCFPVFEVIV